MLRSESLPSKLRVLTRTGIAVVCLVVAFLILPGAAFGQDFTLTATPFNPFAVDPGGDALSNITLGAVNGFNGTVNLSCTVTTQTGGTLPGCQVSPPSVTPSGGATATITTGGTDVATPGLYTVTITGTGPTTTHSAQQNITVLAVTEQFTITVQSAMVPSSVPAGSGAQGVININPINGYVSPVDNSGKGGVTLSCATISPLVTIPPVCSFNPPAPTVSGTVTTSTLTINTQGPIITGAVERPGRFYSFWLPLPMLALVGLGAVAGGKRSRKAWGLLALFVLSGSLLLMPACGNTSTSTTTPNGITPANSYIFTVVGVDVDGNVSSNTTTVGANTTVSLTVTAPTKTP